MRVALFSKYARLGASSRLRSLQYLPELERLGISVEHYPLFDERYLSELYEGNRRLVSHVVRRYISRASQLRRCRALDLVWIEKEALPYIPFFLEKALMPRIVPYIVDYDDAVFHNYDLSSRGLVRSLLGKKIDKVMAGAALVTCGNDYLAERARKAGANRVEHLPTVVDVQRYQPSVSQDDNKKPVIGWVGSPVTQRYLLDLKPVLARICRDHNARVVLVGAQPSFAKELGNVPVEVKPWSEATEVREVARFDIGIMPLPDGPWERGKCGYKLIQYMASGLPVVASPVGVNREIVAEGCNGYLASTSEKWECALKSLLSDRELAGRMGENARHKVLEEYSLNVTAPRLGRLIRELAAGSDKVP